MHINFILNIILGVFSFLSFPHQRIPLDFSHGDKFREAADNYIRPLLTKVFDGSFYAILTCLSSLYASRLSFWCFQGVPSLFSDLSPLYDHPGKVNLFSFKKLVTL